MILFRRKLWRDLREHWSQFIAVAVMAMMSVLIFSGLEGGWRGIQVELDTFAAEQHMPDAWVAGVALTEEDVQHFERLESVERASLVTSVSVTRRDASSEDLLTLATRGDTKVNVPHIVNGESVSDDDGVWLDEAYADANQITTGDQIRISYGDETESLVVQGIILQPDMIAYSGTGLVAPDPTTHGYGLISNDTATRLAGAAPAGQVIKILGDPQLVRAEAPEILGDRYGTFFDRETHPHVATAYERITQLQSLSYLFSALFLLVALLSIFTSIRRLTDIQRGEIATLKALGHSNRLISGYFTAVGTVTVFIGVAVGLAFTPVLSQYILGTQQGSFSLPEWTPAYSLVSALPPVLLLIVCVLASWSATRPMRRATPAEGMRPDAARARRTVLERVPALWTRLRYGTRWTIRDASGSPVRLLMGIVATTGSMMLLMTGFGMSDTLHGQVSLSYSEQYRYDTRVNTVPLAADEAREKLAESAGPGQWLQQTPVRLGADEQSDHTLTVLGAGDLFRVLDHNGAAIPLSDEGAVITDRLSTKLGLGVGDPITIRAAGGDEYAVEITAVTAISEPQGVIVSDSAWSEAGGSFAPTSYLTEGSPDPGILNAAGVTGTVTLEEQRANTQSLVDSLASVFTLINSFAVVLAIVVLYNLGALSFTERIRDYATLRVLGFHHRELRSLASRENLATTLIGWLIGIPAGFWFLAQYLSLFSTDRASYLPTLSPLSFAIASVITISFAMTSTLLLTSRIKSIDMTSALKGVE